MSASWNHEKIASILVEVGRYAGEQQRALTDAAVSFKSDQTLVTEIDVAVEQRIRSALLAIVPNSYVIGEETIRTEGEEYLHSALRNECWVIDPIDGTVPYVFGFDTWGISIGYMVNSVMCEGAVYLPASKLLIVSAGDTIYTAAGADVDADNGQVHFRQFQYRAPRSQHGILSISQDLASRGTIKTPYSVQSIGSCVYSAVQYLCGKYMAVITNVKLWDIAAAIALFEKIGHSMLLHHGETVRSDTISSNFFLTPQTAPYTRWAIKSHLFVAPSIDTCRTLAASVKIAS